MIFQKTQDVDNYDDMEQEVAIPESSTQDDVETVVGPSVNVEGDLSSNGNIIVKGTVTGNINTSKQLTVEKGAKIIANVKAGSAIIAGEVKGNMKIKESLELTSTSRILGDTSVKTLSVEPGAVLYGKIIMPGIEPTDKKLKVNRKKKSIDLEI